MSYQKQKQQSQQKIFLQQQSSLLNQCDENEEILPRQLSGDQNAQSVLIVTSFGLSSQGGQSSKSNFLLTITTIMKTVIGSGILTMPFVISRLGYVFSLIILITIYMATQFTCRLLLKVKNLTKHSNYNSIGYHLFKNKIFQALISLTIIVSNIGVCILEIKILSQTTRKMLKQFITQNVQVLDQFYTSEYFIAFIFCFFLSFFIVAKKIEKLRFMAFIGIMGITSFILAMLLNFMIEMSKNDWILKYQLNAFPRDWKKALSVLPSMILALVYQVNFFPIFKGIFKILILGMRNANDSKMANASTIGLGLCALFYIIVGNCGNALYGYNEIQSNFLLSLKKDEISLPIFLILNVGFLISVFFSFPVMFFAARNNFIALIKMAILKLKKKNVNSINEDKIQQIESYLQGKSKQDRIKKAKFHFYLYSFLLFGFAIGVALGINSIEYVFNVVGATASNAKGFLYPSLFYFTAIIKKKKQKKLKFYIALGIFCTFIPLGITAIIFQYI